MRYFDSFAGIGGFSLGIKQAYESNNEYAHKCEKSKKEKFSQGRERSADKYKIQLYDRNRTAPLCVGYSEIDKYAIQVYQKHFNHKNYGDITKIITSKLPGFDLLVGGFPCQSFSIAGKRKGFNDTRGTLFFDLARILADKRPRYFVFENVKGLLNHEQGKTFQTILGILSNLGYRVEWQVLNSKCFGVPQNRERVFIVGHLGKGSGQQIFPLGENDKASDSSNESKKTSSQTKPASTISTKEGTRADNNFIIINKKGKEKKSKNCASTLTGGGHSGGNHSDMDLILRNSLIRRLTPIECARLQSFPDEWCDIGIDFATPAMYNKGYVNAKKKNSIKILQILQEAISENPRKGRGFAEFTALLKKEILQSQMYAIVIQGNMEKIQCSSSTGELQSEAVNYCNRMYSLWLKQKFRYSSQRQKQIEQLFKKFRGSLSQLPHEIASQGRQLESCEEEEGKRRQICFHWLSDCQKYKMCGNAVTTNVIQAIIYKLIN